MQWFGSKHQAVKIAVAGCCDLNLNYLYLNNAVCGPNAAYGRRTAGITPAQRWQSGDKTGQR